MPYLYKNLFRVKFETGSNFLKSINKIMYTQANIQDPFWRRRCLISPTTVFFFADFI